MTILSEQPEPVVWGLAPCRSCGIGPCICGEFDVLPATPAPLARPGDPSERGVDMPSGRVARGDCHSSAPQASESSFMTQELACD